MAALPGVTRADLNFGAAKLTVEGEGVDVAAILALARAEHYGVESVAGAERPAADRPGPTGLLDGQAHLVWTALSGLLLGAAWAVQLLAAPIALVAGLYAVAIVAGGRVTFGRGARALARLQFDMNALMTVAVTGAVLIGEWREAGVVAFLYGVSESLEAFGINRARRAIRSLMDLAPRTARVLRDGAEAVIPVDDVEVGDRMLVRPGEKIAMDGDVIAGLSAVNQAAITGESVPVEKQAGDPVYAGTLNGAGALTVTVSRRVADTTLSRIIHLVEEAQAQRAPAQRFIDRFARYYTPSVLALAALVALVPPLALGRPWAHWIYEGLALLVVACPCALVVSTPVALVSAIGNAARNGVLIKGGVHLEQAGRVRAVALDKTGTLTHGQPALTDLVPLNGLPPAELLAAAAAVEQFSEHPLAGAVVRAAAGRPLPAAAGFQAMPGRGAHAEVAGRRLYVGSLRLFGELGAPVDAAAAAAADLEANGRAALLVGDAGAVDGVLGVADTLRPDSSAAVQELHRTGVGRVVMLTGDTEATARAVAARVGVDEYRWGLLPADKVDAVRDLRARYGAVAMVGDGVNDAPALAAATVGIAMGAAGTDVALETADIALMSDDLSRLPFLLRLSRATLGVIRQNIALALALKLLAVLAVFPGWLTLWLAILADMGATILVTANSLRLFRIQPAAGPEPAKLALANGQAKQ